jgi:hypothetical protein
MEIPEGSQIAGKKEIKEIQKRFFNLFKNFSIQLEA